jgi:hypothetical protein
VRLLTPFCALLRFWDKLSFSAVFIFQYSAQKIGKYVKLHVLGDFDDIWIGILEDNQKVIRVI